MTLDELIEKAIAVRDKADNGMLTVLMEGDRVYNVFQVKLDTDEEGKQVVVIY